MFSIFSKPFEKSTFEAWAKMSDDVAKVAFLAIPVMIYSGNSVAFKLVNVFLLAFGVYLFILGGRIFRRLTQKT